MRAGGQVDACHYKYDILVKHNNTGKEYTIEIKEDFMVKDTGNVTVEYKSRGKFSGLLTTQADFYVYKLHYKEPKYFIMRVSTLKNAMKDGKYITKVNGGDKGSNTLMWLLKDYMMIDISKEF
jgi:hypothetical protein